MQPHDHGLVPRRSNLLTWPGYEARLWAGMNLPHIPGTHTYAVAESHVTRMEIDLGRMAVIGKKTLV